MRSRSPDDTRTLPELLRHPDERVLRDGLLIALTFTAGWIDAIAYVDLGHVFASFMSGNFLFLGISAVHGERAVFLRTTVALLAFAAGALVGELFLGKGPARRTRTVWLGTLATYLAFDALGLVGFAIASVLTRDSSGRVEAQVALLAVAAFAMGPIGILVGALEVPGVVANALTGTLLQLGGRFAQNLARREPTNPLRTRVLLALCFTYVMAAAVVTLSRPWTGRVFVAPAVLIAVVLVLCASGKLFASGRTGAARAT